MQKAPTIEQAIAHGYTLLQMGRKTDALACFSVAAAQPQISSPDQHLAVRLGEWILGRTENTPLEALESWECSDSVAFTSALLYVWRLTTIRLRMETMKGYDFKLKDASLNEALELQRRFRKCCSTFVTLLPHEDRELGLILCLAGRPKAAARHLKLSLEAAKLSDLILERALTTRELSRVRKFLGKDFPRFNCQSAVKTLERLGYNLPKGEGHQAPRRNKTPETLQQEFLDLAGQVVRSRSDSSLLRAVDSFCHTLLPELQTARVATENSGSDETVFRLCGVQKDQTLCSVSLLHTPNPTQQALLEQLQSLVAASLTNRYRRDQQAALRRRAEDEAKVYSRLFENSPIPAALVHNDGEIQASNLVFRNLCPQATKICHLIQEDCTLTELQDRVIRIVGQDGAFRWYRPVVAEQDDQTWYLALIDVTDENTARLERIHEMERKIMAAELHDGLTGPLMNLYLQLQFIRDEPDTRERERLLGELKEEARQLARLKTDVTSVLRRPSEVSFRSSLEDHFKTLTGFQVELIMAFSSEPSPLQTAHLFRIVQESVTNVRRHAGVDKCVVLCSEVGGRYVVKIKDKGTGSRVDSETGGLGTKTMRERASLLGGTLEIHNKSGQGTTLTVSIPTHRPNPG